jgi:hypothetical protein
LLCINAVARKALAHFLGASHLLKDVLAGTLGLIAQACYFFQLPVTPNAGLKNLIVMDQQVVNANLGNGL